MLVADIEFRIVKLMLPHCMGNLIILRLAVATDIVKCTMQQLTVAFNVSTLQLHGYSNISLITSMQNSLTCQDCYVVPQLRMGYPPCVPSMYNE